MLRLLRQTVVILLLGCVPILVLEGALRLAGWPTDRVRTIGKLINLDPETFEASVGMFQPRAASRVSWPPELAYDVRINSLGLRGEEAERKPVPGRLRILALGDSNTFGFYLEEDETWPARLAADLRNAGLDVEVLNAGVGGWSIHSEALFFEERGIQLEPDLVVLAFTANDIRDLERSKSVFLDQRDRLGKGRGALKTVLYDTAVYEALLRWRIWSKRTRQRIAGRVPHPLSSFDVPPERLEPLWKSYAEWLDRLRADLDGRGIPLVLVYLPDAYKLEHGIPAEDEARLRALAEERSIAFVSPLPDFEGEPVERLFHVPLDPHLGPEGARRVAVAVGERILAERDRLTAHADARRRAE